VAVEAAPAAPFEMAEPDLLLELSIIAFDAPAQFRQVDHSRQADVVGQRRKPVFRRLLFALGPFDQ
jgi:hypothetical protein